MYAFRDRYAKEWDLDLIVRRLPAGRGDRPDACRPRRARRRARPLGLKERSLQERGFTGRDRRHPARRGGDPRQGARVQPARRRRRAGTCRTSRRSSGTSSRPTCRRARTCASIRCCTGPSSTSGATSSARGIPVCRLYFARDGKRYRSLGDQDITFSGRLSNASTDRRDHRRARDHESVRSASGRAMDHEREDAFERLRADGYM